jgi:excisionase family DNA binding protein
VTRLLTAAQVGERFQVPVSRIYAAARRGELPSVRLGRYVRFTEEALARWIAEQQNGGRP